jgi:hypothetical protein
MCKIASRTIEEIAEEDALDSSRRGLGVDDAKPGKVWRTRLSGNQLAHFEHMLKCDYCLTAYLTHWRRTHENTNPQGDLL